MKIEKINNNQIKCVLNKNDLVSRHIKVSELAYGTEKAQELFKDMMDQASDQFGFEAQNAPLMIEAVPLSAESIMLIITKVDNPEELEDKFVSLPSSKARSFKKKDDAEKTNLPVKFNKTDTSMNVFFVYSFHSFDDVSSAAKNLTSLPIHNSVLYKDISDNTYYLTIVSEDVEKSDVSIAQGILSEYGDELLIPKTKLNYYDEHYDKIIKENAVSVLKNL